MERSHQSGWRGYGKRAQVISNVLLSAIILGIVVAHTIGIHGLIKQGCWASHKLHQAAVELAVMAKLQTLEAAQPEVRV